MTAIIILTIVVLAILYYVVILRNGNLSFWKKAVKHPNFVYEQFLKDDAWIIDVGNNKMDKAGLDGPFLLYIPSVGKTIKFYGKVGKYEDSQKRIENELIN